jgi:hypothetical protein
MDVILFWHQEFAGFEELRALLFYQKEGMLFSIVRGLWQGLGSARSQILYTEDSQRFVG